MILVSEGFPNLLPPQMQDRISSMPGLGTPTQPDPVGGRTPREEASTFFANADLQSDLMEVYRAANRYNTAIYAVDPRGLAATEFGIERNVSQTRDREALATSIDTLRILADQTDGRAIVNQNDLEEAAQIVRDTSACLSARLQLGQASDGKFHEIGPSSTGRAAIPAWLLGSRRMRRRRARFPRRRASSGGQAAFAAMAVPERRRLIRTWIGMAPGENGNTKVTFVWEPVPPPPGARSETPARVSIIATGDGGDPYFRGRAPEAGPGPSAPNAGPMRVVFDAAPGPLELRLTVEGAGAQVLDREIREMTVADLSGAGTRMTTPEVFRARTAREWQMLAADAQAVPRPEREFRRTDRLLVRVGAHGGTVAPVVTARLLNRSGQPVSVLSVSPSEVPGRTHQLDVPLAAFAVGEYLIEITAKGEAGEVSELLAFRVSG